MRKGLRRLAAALLLTLLALAPLGCMARQVTEPMYIYMMTVSAMVTDEPLRAFACDADGGYAVVGLAPGVPNGFRVALEGDKLYWIGYSEQGAAQEKAQQVLFSLDLQSGERQALYTSARLQELSIRPYGLLAMDGWMYFAAYRRTDPDSTGELYRVSQAGLERVSDNLHYLWGFTSDGTWIYYADYEPVFGRSRLCKIKADGSEHTVLGKLYASRNMNLFYAEGRVFYVHNDLSVRSFSVEDGSERVEMENLPSSMLAVGGGHLFYLQPHEQWVNAPNGWPTDYTLHARSLDGGTRVDYGPVDVWDGGMLSDCLYFGSRGFVINMEEPFNEDIRQRNRYFYYPYDGRPPVELELTHWE